MNQAPAAQVGQKRKSKRMSASDALKVAKKISQRERTAVSQMGSPGEERLARDLKVTGINYQREFKFLDTHKFRSDFYLPEFNCLVEVEGGTRGGGKSRHTTHEGYSKDQEKYNEAVIKGYSVLGFTTEQVNKGIALATIERFIKEHKARSKSTGPIIQVPNQIIKTIIESSGAES